VDLAIDFGLSGPIQSHLRVMELESGKIYGSAFTASMKLDEKFFEILNSCNFGKPTVNGRRFIWR
jgi:hypothetical protein